MFIRGNRMPFTNFSIFMHAILKFSSFGKEKKADREMSVVRDSNMHEVSNSLGTYQHRFGIWGAYQLVLFWHWQDTELRT